MAVTASAPNLPSSSINLEIDDNGRVFIDNYHNFVCDTPALTEEQMKRRYFPTKGGGLFLLAIFQQNYIVSESHEVIAFCRQRRYS